DHDEVFETVVGGGERDVPGAEDVVFNGLENVGLHHGDVLVRGRVIEDGRAVLLQDFGQALLVLDAADLRVEGDVGKELAHFAIEVEQGGFGDLKTDDGTRVEARDLAAQFRADGARGAGDKDRVAGEFTGNSVVIEADRDAAEEVFDGYIADLSGETVPLDDFG